MKVLDGEEEKRGAVDSDNDHPYVGFTSDGAKLLRWSFAQGYQSRFFEEYGGQKIIFLRFF